MQAIRSYVENVFANLPKTNAVLRAKSDMLANMEEKYHEFKAQGRTENEAVGKVIAEFGNIDELLAELNISTPNSYREDSIERRQVSREEAEGYIKAKRRAGLLNGIGVFFILCGVATLLLMNVSTYDVEWIPFSLSYGMNPAWGIVSMLLMIAIAVGLFIYAGIGTEDYNYLKWDFELKGIAQKWTEDRRQEFMRYYPLTLVVGVILCILAPLIIILPIVLMGMENMAVTLVSAMLILIAVAIFLFVYFGNIKEAYDRLLKYGEYRHEAGDKIVNAVSSVVWPLIVIIFLLNGFLGGRWATAWIIFPIAGLSFAIFNGVVKAIRGYKE